MREWNFWASQFGILTAMTTLNINQVSKTYNNGVRALQNVQLTIGRGMFGLLGPNGAGKSSLLRTIATLQAPDSGDIQFDGRSIFDDPNRFRQVLGYLPQDFGVYPRASALDLLDYFARLKGWSRGKERRAHIQHLLELVNLSSAAHKSVDTYSGGMRQRFGIAQALIGDPQVIVVDEPTAGLDPEERNRFYALLHQLASKVIVILSTHIVADVTNLCQRLAIIRDGQIRACGEPSELVDQLQGLLWQRVASGNDLESFQQPYQLLSTRLFQGQQQIVVVADECPGDGFSAKLPDLEDVYFSCITTTQSHAGDRLV